MKRQIQIEITRAIDNLTKAERKDRNNLVRAVQLLKEKGFWIYGADAGGSRVNELTFSARSVVVMGSEGSGIARLLEEQCDSIVSIPTCGKIDSLNVSVAAGVLLYEVYRQSL